MKRQISDSLNSPPPARQGKMSANEETNFIAVLTEKFAELSKQLEDSLTKKIQDLKKELFDEMNLVKNSMEFLHKATEEFENSFHSYKSSNDEEIATLKAKIVDQSKIIEKLLSAEKSRDARERALNLVVYGIPEVTRRGKNPIQWNEEMRKQIVTTMGIDLPADSVKGYLRMGSSTISSTREMNPPPVKIYFTSDMGKATFYSKYLSKRNELVARRVRARNDYNLETRKFRSAVDLPRTKLHQLGYMVRFIGNGDTLLVIGPEGKKRGECKSYEELMEIIKIDKIDLDQVTA